MGWPRRSRAGHGLALQSTSSAPLSTTDADSVFPLFCGDLSDFTGGMGSLGGAVAAGFLLGILQSFASMNEVKAIFPGIDQIIIYLIAVVVLLVRPRGLMGRKGVMES